MLTGSGLKDLQAIRRSIIIPEAIEPDIMTLKKYFTQNQAEK
jgi:hypothetical protein